eukprot:5426963-Prymnesium_polylepis.1
MGVRARQWVVVQRWRAVGLASRRRPRELGPRRYLQVEEHAEREADKARLAEKGAVARGHVGEPLARDCRQAGRKSSDVSQRHAQTAAGSRAAASAKGGAVHIAAQAQKLPRGRGSSRS